MGTTLKNVGLVYYCNYVLGTYNDGITQTLISVLGGIPMGIGIFLVWPLAKRFGKKNVTMIGFWIYAVGSAICWMAPTNMYAVLVGQFIKNVGGLPCAYVFMALFADVLDHMEWKTGFRSDGTAMSIYNIIAVTAAGLCTGVFNFFLSKTGYVAPVLQGDYLADMGQYVGLTTQKSMEQILTLKATDAVAFVQPSATNDFITFAFVGLEVITGLACAGILMFVTVEKTIKRKQDILVEREKERFAREGREWAPAEERNRMEMERQDAEAEQIFLQELKKKCEKKGLSFEAESQKHGEAVFKKKAKAAEKQKSAETKEQEKAAKAKQKQEKKTAQWTPEQWDKFNAKAEAKKAKDEAHWIKEKEKGEAYYAKIQGELAKIR